jgi:uncharacterized GH25 family protein
MKKGYCLAILILLIISGMVLTASASPVDRWSTSGDSAIGAPQGQEDAQMAQASEHVTLQLYVFDRANGELLPGVGVMANDSSGHTLEGTTDSRGSVVISGQPGTWQFKLSKEGYKTFSLEYPMTQSQAAATYLLRLTQPAEQVPSVAAAYNQRAAQSEQAPQIQKAVDFTVYVNEGSLGGAPLSGVDITGQDAAGNSFEETTDSNGAAVISGEPGTWQFTFSKQGYDSLNLNYNVTETEEAATYLQRPAQPAELQEQATLTIDVHESSLNGTALSGVDVTGKDATGNNFEGTTDSNGAVAISGAPGTWQFTFSKQGYDTLTLSYNVTQTEEVAAYLTAQSANPPQEPVDFTVYVHEDTINGTALSGVDVAGKDGAGNSFEGTTDSNGVAVISGIPGAWQFTFSKQGYGTLNLNYNVTATDYGDVYLENANRLSQSEVPVISEAVPAQAISSST